MNGITGKEQIYTAYDGGSIAEPSQREKMLSNMMAPKKLVLKEGAQVRGSRPSNDILLQRYPRAGHAHQEPG